jgi:hypothetical protein
MHKGKVQDQFVLATLVFSKQIRPGKSNPPQTHWGPCDFNGSALVHFQSIPGRATNSVSPTFVIGNKNPAKSWGPLAWRQRNGRSYVIERNDPCSVPVLSTYSSCPQNCHQTCSLQTSDRGLARGPACRVACLHILILRYQIGFLLDTNQVFSKHCIVIHRQHQAAVRHGKSGTSRSSLRFAH